MPADAQRARLPLVVGFRLVGEYAARPLPSLGVTLMQFLASVPLMLADNAATSTPGPAGGATGGKADTVAFHNSPNGSPAVSNKGQPVVTDKAACTGTGPTATCENSPSRPPPPTPATSSGRRRPRWTGRRRSPEAEARENRRRLAGASQILNEGDASLRPLAERLQTVVDKAAP